MIRVSLALLFFFLILTLEPVYASFTVTDISPSEITATDAIITISASASGLSNSNQYLQAGLTKEGEANYFGFTKNTGDQWHLYQSTPTLSDLYSFTPQNGTWSGQVQAKIDITDSGYKGPGNYSVKLFKYISSPNSRLDSNVVTVSINIPASPPPAPAPPSPSPTSTSSSQTNDSKEITWIASNTTVRLGEDFKLSVQLKNFETAASYYLKIRAGQSADKLTKGETKNGNSYLSDNDSWTQFPQIQTDGSGNWVGDLAGKIISSEPTGSYIIKVRAKKASTDTTYDTADKNLTFSAATPVTAPTPPPPSPAVKTSSVSSPIFHQEILGTNTISTMSASAAGVTGTESAYSFAPEQPIAEPNTAENILVAGKKTDDSVSKIITLVAGFSIVMGTILFACSKMGVWKKLLPLLSRLKN